MASKHSCWSSFGPKPGPMGPTLRRALAVITLTWACFGVPATAGAAIDDGPGGPILVIAGDANPFGRYQAEILRNEGLNEFDVSNLSAVSAATLATHDVVILGDTPLSAAQVTLLSDWVQDGGNLIAMRPDPQLAGLLGLTSAGGTLANAYLKVDSATAPGTGITSATMQFHGTADRYTLTGATAVATLFSDATTATTNPAVTLRDVGVNGGQAAAFTYDLARSVVYTRQGNPAWAGDERDGITPLRSDDLFFGAKAGDPQPDWVDLDKVAIPQADEQQRLLANLIGKMNADRSPLPRFWYLPRGEKAAVVMTGDDHSGGGTVGRFNQYAALNPGCSVADWDCVRGTSYVFPGSLTDAQADALEAQGFEIALHVNTGCGNASLPTYETTVSGQLAAFAAEFGSVDTPATNRNHCIAWGGWVDPAKVEFDHGLRLDTNYYFWPPAWVQDRPGMFTGSGLPMRFADLDGSMLDVYQAATQMTDESGQSIPATINALLNKALGPEGYYGAFTANMHTDSPTSTGSDAIVAEAVSRGVPVVSAKQMLTWLDGRNGSSFESMSFAGDTLSFTVAPAAGANGLQAMVPTESSAGTLTAIERDGNPVAFTTQTIKGVSYAFVGASAGAYEATYAAAPPAPTGLTDTTVDEFGAGSGDTTVTDSAGGEVTLTPAIDAPFDGSALPADWTSGTWESAGGGPGGTTTVAGGSLTVNGTFAATSASFGSGRSIEFDATFGAAPFQHVGFGVDLNNVAAWAMFSSNNTSNQIWARTNASGSTINTPLPGVIAGLPHRYRIDWNASTVDFYVDGALVATHNATITDAMRPIASDYMAAGPGVSVDWLRMTPYATPGTFTSRVFDAGGAVDWDTLTWNADVPAGTSVALSVRTGDSSTPDGTWSAFAPVAASGDAIAAHSRYLQYRAVLTTSDTATTPVLRDVTATYGDETAPNTQIGSGPSGTITVNSATFTFSADETGSTFECRLDSGSWVSCTSPETYSWLADGPHTFDVRATDTAANTDATPASRSFTVATADTAAPDTVIDTGPAGTIGVNSATFTFHSTESGSTFQCRLDTGAWLSCTSPKTYSSLADGPHTFDVRATDASANTDATPASRSFTVATTGAGPDITIDRPWQGARYSHYSNPKTAHNALYSCAAAVTCTAEVDGNPIANGDPFPRPHPDSAPYVVKTFTVTATDGAGHTSTESVTYRVYTFESLVEDLSPIAYYRLNDGYDADEMHAVIGPDGEYKNGQDSEPWGISGDGDASRFFTGADGYAYVNGITAPRRYTLSVFVNFAEDDRNAMVMQHGGAGAVWYDGDNLHFQPVDWDSVELTSPDIGANKWHHVAATFGSGTARLYLDGELVDTASSTKATSGTSTFYLAYGDKAPWLRGGLDEAAYFGSVLNVDQIHQIWLADPPPDKPAASADAPASSPAAAAPAAAAADPAAAAETTPAEPVAVASAPRTQIGKVTLLRGSLRTMLRCSGRCSGTVTMVARVGAKNVTLGSRRFALQGAGKVVLKLSAKARRTLKSPKLRYVTLTVRDSTGAVTGTGRGLTA
jgi:hypothetical protein